MSDIPSEAKSGAIQLLKDLGQKYGPFSVLLIVLAGCWFWQSYQQQQALTEERKALQAAIEEKNREDTKYYRGEFRTVIENNSEAMNKVAQSVDEFSDKIERNTEVLQRLENYRALGTNP